MVCAEGSVDPIIVRERKCRKQVYVLQTNGVWLYVGHTLSSLCRTLTNSYQANRGDLQPAVSTNGDWMERLLGETSLFVVDRWSLEGSI